MKKKIINGILMVALVAATSTSFVSCKDTSEDVKTDLMAQVNALKADLDPRLQQAETDIDNLENRATALEGRATDLENRMTTAEGKITQLRTDVDGLRTDLTALEARVATNETNITQLQSDAQDLKDRMGVVENSISAIVDALSKMVTSVTVNATSTSILSNSKLFPGINMQFLGAAYGKATTTGKFPSTTTLTGHGTALVAADFEGVDQYSWSNGDILPKADEDTELADAGTIWFTLNPSNVSVKNLKDLKLVDSQNKESFVTIKKENVVADEETILNWSITRAEESKDTLWKAQAGIDLEAEDLATIAPAEIIDYQSIASDIRTMVEEVKQAAQAANRNNYTTVAKATTKGLIKESAQIVASLLNSKLPALPALALKAEWEDTVGVRSVLSDYSIAATAYKPIAFNFGKDIVAEGRTVSLDKIEALVARILNNIKNRVNSIGINNVSIATIDFDPNNFTASTKIAVWSNPGDDADFVINTDDTIAPDATHTTLKTSTTVTADMVAQVTNLKSLINTSLTGANDDIQSIIDQVKSLQALVTKYANKAQSFEERVVEFLEGQINRVLTKVSTDGLTRVLEPIILFQAGDNYSVTRFYEGQVIPAGKITLIPTTMTNELLAPAFKKYVAIKNNTTGEFVYQNVLTKGDANFKQITETLAAGEYTIIYSALDFYGVQISKKYNVTVQ